MPGRTRMSGSHRARPSVSQRRSPRRCRPWSGQRPCVPRSALHDGDYPVVTRRSGKAPSVRLSHSSACRRARYDTPRVRTIAHVKVPSFTREIGGFGASREAKAGRTNNFDKLVLVSVAKNAMTFACTMQRLRHGFAASFVWSPSNWTSGDGGNGRRRKLGMSAGAGFRWWLEPPAYLRPTIMAGLKELEFSAKRRLVAAARVRSPGGGAGH